MGTETRERHGVGVGDSEQGLGAWWFLCRYMILFVATDSRMSVLCRYLGVPTRVFTKHRGKHGYVLP